MATTTTTVTAPAVDQEYINKMYDSSLNSQKQTLQSDYEKNVSNLEAEKQATQKQTDTNLTRTYVEAAKAAKNYNEVQNAYGLTSGAMGQARLAQDNQLQADMTALRAAQTTADAEIERERSLLAKEYANAIAKAQSDNDMQRAQALYDAAKAEEERLNELAKIESERVYQQTLLQEERAYQEKLSEAEKQEALQKESAELLASMGDYSLLAQLYGWTPEQLALFQAQNNSGGGGGDSSQSKSYRSYSSGSESTQEEEEEEPTEPTSLPAYNALLQAYQNQKTTTTTPLSSGIAANIQRNFNGSSGTGGSPSNAQSIRTYNKAASVLNKKLLT